MPPSEKDSLDVIAEYVANSRAVLDSLTRLKDVRGQLFISKRTLQALQTQNAGLLADKIKTRNDANEMAERLWNCNEKYGVQSKKLLKANVEKWIWRGVATIGTFLLVKRSMPP